MSASWLRSLRGGFAGSSTPSRHGIVVVAVLLALATFAAGVSVERLGDPLLFLFAVPLGLAAIAYGLRGGVGMGVFTASLATVWWVERGYHDGLAWISSSAFACLAVGALLGWFAESRNALSRSIAYHRALSLDMIATANYEGYFTEVNPAFTHTLGYAPEELLSRPFMDFVHPDDIEPTLAAVVEQTEEGRGVLNFQNRYRTKDGSYRWLEWTSRPDPSCGALIAVARDVTDRKHLEELEREYQNRLEAMVRERTKELNRRNAELEEARSETLRRLALAAEFRDDETYRHTARIGHASGLIAAALGLPEHEVHLIRDAAPLHDIGKLGVSDNVLLKPGALAPDELEHMRRHAETGASILSGSMSDVLRVAEEIARCHHEWWDGSGYPAALRGEEIPLCARIVAVADVFDALTHKRPYKPAWPVDEAVAELRRLAGRQFDPRVLRAFAQLDPYLLAGGDVPLGARDGIQAA